MGVQRVGRGGWIGGDEGLGIGEWGGGVQMVGG